MRENSDVVPSFTVRHGDQLSFGYWSVVLVELVRSRVIEGVFFLRVGSSKVSPPSVLAVVQNVTSAASRTLGSQMGNTLYPSRRVILELMKLKDFILLARVSVD